MVTSAQRLPPKGSETTPFFSFVLCCDDCRTKKNDKSTKRDREHGENSGRIAKISLTLW